jgi:phospholipid/cholesterol/gamma-HCH transport system permease protein
LATAAFGVDRGVTEGVAEIRLRGAFTLRDAGRVLTSIRAMVGPDSAPVRVDLSRVSELDGGTAALLVALAEELRESGRSTDLVGARGRVSEILQLYSRRARESELPAPRHLGALDQMGRATLASLQEVREILGMTGDIVIAAVALLRAPGSLRWRSVFQLMERAGADAVPIVAIITFMIGLVTGFQAALQLRQFGADIFIADAVGLSMTRELGPLMTAIIAAGRSGAAFAAELGTMQVSEEIDALHTLGLDEYRFLVFPRMIALVLVLPMLTLMGDVVGILGGMSVAVFNLGLAPVAYLVELRGAVDLWDVGSGLIKSVFFALAIGLIACQMGLAARGGAEGVGRSTTSSVVTILFALIAIDAVFTVVFNAFGL